eukprot:COSAG03_NODE_7829_length_868_cov_1.481144_2_plen_146_part_00
MCVLRRRYPPAVVEGEAKTPAVVAPSHAHTGSERERDRETERETERGGGGRERQRQRQRQRQRELERQRVAPVVVERGGGDVWLHADQRGRAQHGRHPLILAWVRATLGSNLTCTGQYSFTRERGEERGAGREGWREGGREKERQ